MVAAEPSTHTPIALTKNLSSHRGVALTPIPHNSTRKTFSEISQFLSIPSSVIKRSVSKGKGRERSVSGARVLTSEASFALMLEKERQKKEEEQAKQRLKLEREEKRPAKEKEKEIKTAERLVYTSTKIPTVNMPLQNKEKDDMK